MMKGDRTCPSNKPYDTGSGFNGSCSPGWRRHWVRWASATSGWSGWWNWAGGGVAEVEGSRRAGTWRRRCWMPTTRALVERLRRNPPCAGCAAGMVPSEATFSAGLRNSPPATCRGACMRPRQNAEGWRATCDSTASRDEKPKPAPGQAEAPTGSAKDEPRAKEPRRLQRQASNAGGERPARRSASAGSATPGAGPALHIESTAAFRSDVMHDSLARLTASRVDSLYDLMTL